MTVLSGDVLGDDLPATFGNYNDNTIRVIVAAAGVSGTLDSLAVRSGNASGTADSLAGKGGGLLAHPGTNLTLNRLAFSANKSNGNGGAIFSLATMQITNASFYSNTSVTNGGALAITSTLTISGCTFQNNQGIFAGAIQADGPATIANSTFRSNRATNFNGGAINASQPLTVSGSTFLKNQAGFNGGAIEASAALKISTSSFQQNQAIVFTGGAVESILGVLDIQSSSFVSNTATQAGGAVSISLNGATINNSQMTDNRVLGGNCLPACSVGKGGAIFSAGPLTVTKTTLANNFARLIGGGLAGNGETVVLNSVLTGNKAGTVGDTNNPGKGGGIFTSGKATLRSNIFQSNAAGSPSSEGGGLYMQGGPLLASGNLYSLNTATRFGGGASVVNGLISDDRFLNNTASSEGGGVIASGNLTVTHTLFDGNVSSLSGAISAQGVPTLELNVDNSLFIRNQRVSSAGVTDMRLFDLTARLVNNTFADPGTAGGTSINIFRSNLLANNNIFANYGVSLSVGQAVSDLQEDYNLFFNAPTGTGVTSGGHSSTSNPLFVNPAGQDYRLQAISPAREAGLDSALPAMILTDLGGGRRRLGNIDQGAFEFQILLFLPTVSK